MQALGDVRISTSGYGIQCCMIRLWIFCVDEFVTTRFPQMNQRKDFSCVIHPCRRVCSGYFVMLESELRVIAE